MRNLIVMRGAPGCGKSTFIEKMGWTPYALCADTIRLMFEAPVMDHENGCMMISQKNDTRVWKFLLENLEVRMSKGEFCVIDATHSKSQDFQKYKKLMEKYRYRGYCIDFSDVSKEVAKKQNLSRPQYKGVPERVIDNIYARMETQEVPGYFTVFNHNDVDEINERLNNFIPIDISEDYDKLVVFGDIHGCWEPLKKYFDEHPFSERTYYVFVGDYLDRGIQNKEIINWLLINYNRKNIILLQGNHERWLMEYANGDYDDEIREGKKNLCKSSEFFDSTIPQISEFKKKDLRQICRKFGQVSYLKFNDKKFLISHAGIGFVPTDLTKISSETFIRGGKYEEPIDEWFENHLTDDSIIQIHGHRNIENIEINKFPHSWNLCDEIEFGKFLRVVEIEKEA